MIVHQLRFALRNLRRNPLFSFINIAGLGVSLTAFLLMALYIQYELSYDDFHEKGARIYRVADDKQTPDVILHGATSSGPVAPALTADFPQIEEAVRLVPGDALVKYNDRVFQERNIFYADPNIFTVFSFRLLEGDPATALQEPMQVVITQAMARKYFGTDPALGQTLLFDGRNMKVSGVVKDVPVNAHLAFDCLLSMATAKQPGSGYEWLFENWYSNLFYTYILLRDANAASAITARLEAFDQKHREPGTTTRHHYALEPLRGIYLGSDRENQVGKTGNRSNLYIFSAVAIFILLLACVNFINLSTARAADRAKEVAVKKVAGAGRAQVVVQFLLESWLTTALGLAIAVLACFLLLGSFNTFSGKALELNLLNPLHLSVIAGLFVSIGILAGSYPALVLSGYKPATALKGKVPASLLNLGIRKGLVVFQFAVSVVLIVCSIVVYKQLQYLRAHDLGFQPAQTLVINFEGDDQVRQQYPALRQELLRIPGVSEVTASSNTPGDGKAGGWSMEFKRKDGQSIQTELPIYLADFNFLAQYKIPVVAGKQFSANLPADSNTSMMVNETFLARLGFRTPEEAIGVDVKMYPTDGKIIGVFKDFHFESLQKAVSPLVMRVMPDKWRVFSVRLEAGSIGRSIPAIAATWKKFVPGRPIDYHFLDDSFNRQYESETKFGQVFAIFTILAILIACLGLFGLALFSIRQRTKEIGIRKVLGANVSGITAMLSRDYLKLVVLALLLASPVAWFGMSRWLQPYAYRISINGWIFVLAGLLAVGVALLTIVFHALRAAMANPVHSLRSD